jgi:hypothetical protein
VHRDRSRISLAYFSNPRSNNAENPRSNNAEQERGQIVETAIEARGAERGPTVRNVLVWSLGLVVAGFAVVYFLYFKT